MKLLVISYYYPPQKGIGGKRLFRFTSRLPALGIDPVVLTTPWPPAAECDLGQPHEAPGVIVDRAYVPSWFWRYYREDQGMSSGPGPIAHLCSRLDRITGPPIDAMEWLIPFAIRRALQLAQQHRFDAVLSTSAPYSSHVVGMRVAARLNIPFYADLRDPWSFNFFFRKRTGRTRERDLRVEKSVFAAADRLFLASNATKIKYAELYPAFQDKLLTIYSGFDTDIESPKVGEWPGKLRPRIAVVHFGRFYGDRRLTGTLSAFHAAVQSQKFTPHDLQLLILGDIAKADLTQLQDIGLDSFIKIVDMMPYDEGLAVLRGADVLFLCDYGIEPYFVPGKTFDYLRIRRPIFAISANQELCSLIHDTGMGRAVHPDDAAAQRDLWIELAMKPPAQALGFQPNDEALERLSANDSARQLAEALIKR